MHTGGTQMYCQMYSSGRPNWGLSARSSQSSSEIRRNKSNTRKGFKSSCALLKCGASSPLPILTAVEKVLRNSNCSSSVFFCRNFSWTIFKTPAFLTVPFVEPQCGQYSILRAAALTALNVCARCRFSSPGRRKRRRNRRRSGSSNSTRAHDLQII